ncbi:carbohydrate ABC transporter permease [Raoultibacter massiliensis]|uniref:carbohydrate ABC transporter permease n=1 Tax=Raoultibacter massiliensis TaxID=1852371 RepID=UPI001C670C90|nr:carbohydrate ABC transporter permease [Raoultibacter massiliensis]
MSSARNKARKEATPKPTGEPWKNPGRARVRGMLFLLAMAALGFCAFLPLAMLALGSLMSASELASTLGGVIEGGNGFAEAPLLPLAPTPESYVAVLVDTPGYHVLFWNSAVITACVLAGQLAVATPAAWALARFGFRGRDALFFLYVLLMMLPFQTTMLPNYLVLNALGINDTLAAVILPGAFSAFPVFIMRHFFATIPNSLIESARLDGASEFAIFLKIGVPLGAPGIFASLVLGFFEYWNLVEQPLAFLRDQTLWPLSLFQPAIASESIGLVFASTVIASIPAVLVFATGREYLEQGIAATTRKDR